MSMKALTLATPSTTAFNGDRMSKVLQMSMKGQATLSKSSCSSSSSSSTHIRVVMSTCSNLPAYPVKCVHMQARVHACLRLLRTHAGGMQHSNIRP